MKNRKDSLRLNKKESKPDNGIIYGFAGLNDQFGPNEVYVN